MHVRICDCNDDTVSFEVEGIGWSTLDGFRYMMRIAKSLEGSFDISWGPDPIIGYDFDGYLLEVYDGMCNLFRHEPGGVETGIEPKDLRNHIVR